MGTPRQEQLGAAYKKEATFWLWKDMEAKDLDEISNSFFLPAAQGAQH